MMLRILFKKTVHTALLCFLTLSTIVAQEKSWQFGAANQDENGTAVLNLPAENAFIVVSTGTSSNGSVSTVRKVTSSGNVIWEKPILNAMLNSICEADNNSYFVAGQSNNKAFIQKINSNGGLSQQFIDTSTGSYISAVYKTPTGIIAAGSRNSIPLVLEFDNSLGTPTISILPNLFFEKAESIAGIGENTWIAATKGNGADSAIIWKHNSPNTTALTFPTFGTDVTINFFTMAADSSMYLGLKSTIDPNFEKYSSILYHFSANGVLISKNSNLPTINAGIAIDNSGVVCTGTVNNKLLLISLSKNLQTNWSKTIGYAPSSQGHAIASTTSGYVMVGETGVDVPNGRDVFLVTTGKTPLFANQVTGALLGVQTCGNASGVPLSDWIIKGTTIANGKTHYAITDKNGHYTMVVDTTGLIELETSQALGSGYKSCAIVKDTVLKFGVIKAMPTLFAQDTSKLPILRVDITGDILIPGDTTTYDVLVQNLRTVSIPNAAVKLSFAKELVRVSESLTATLLSNDTLLIPIGTINASATLHFKVKRKLDITTIIPGKTYCSSVESVPNVSSWKGPRLLITSQCFKDSARFILKNVSTGTGTFSSLSQKNWAVIIEDVILRTGHIDTLKTGKSDTITVKTDAKTYAFVINQGSNNPYGTFASARLEDCGLVGGSIPQSTYSDFDEAKGYAVQCLQATATAPLKSQSIVFPLGYQYIPNILSYAVQDSITLEPLHIIVNNDTVNTKAVVVEIVMSKNLSLLQFQPGASSHPYEIEMQGSKLIVRFENMVLTPVSLNAKKSRGFFTYSIKIPIGDTINNEGEKFTTATSQRFGYSGTLVFVDSISRLIKPKGTFTTSIKMFPEPSQSLMNISFAPNPFEESTQVSVTDDMIGATFSIYNLQGRLVQQTPIAQNTFRLDAKDLQQGLYLCTIQKQGRLLARGKVIVQ
jgi:hypothetical protein